MTAKDRTAYYKQYDLDRKDKKRQYYQEHQEERCAYQRAYRTANKDAIAAANKAYAEEHDRSAYYRQYCQGHRSEKKQYYQEHREERLVAQKAYRVTHRDEIYAYGAIRRALIAGAMIDITTAQKEEIAEIYRIAREEPRVRCYLCGDLIPLGERHVDHIVPVSKGGSSRPSNLAVTCAKCNLEKSAKTPEEIGLLI